MACREVEMGKNKCERYWPTIHQSIEIDSIKVSTVRKLLYYKVQLVYVCGGTDQQYI